jgi:serine/threonine protein kinase
VGTTIDSYEIVRLIGEGGMGRVFEVRHHTLGKSFALKLMSETLEQDADAIDRFRMETLALGKLDHGNILQAVDAGNWNGRPYLVTQFLSGTDLGSHVAARGGLSLEQVRQIAVQIAQGLQAAHAVGLFHRDIKPSNLFLDNSGTVKLLDFGLVRSTSSESCTRTGCLMGSVDYLSPEQAADPRKADARSDIYSFGCTLIYLLSGRHPFPDEDHPGLSAKLIAHQTRQPDWLELHRAKTHPLLSLIDQMIAKDPERRPQSVEQVLASLQQILPQFENERSVPTNSRLRAWSLSAAGLLVITLAGLGVLQYSSLGSFSESGSSSTEIHVEMSAGAEHPPDAAPKPHTEPQTPSPAELTASHTAPSLRAPAKETLHPRQSQSARGANLPAKSQANLNRAESTHGNLVPHRPNSETSNE